MRFVSPISKAIAGFLAPGVVIIGEAIVDGKHGDMPTSSEWLLALVVSVATFAGVYIAPKNRPA